MTDVRPLQAVDGAAAPTENDMLRAANNELAEALDEARARINFLAVAGSCFAIAHDEDAAFDFLGRLALPLLGDCCLVDMQTENGLHRRAVFVDPGIYGTHDRTQARQMPLHEDAVSPMLAGDCEQSMYITGQNLRERIHADLDLSVLEGEGLKHVICVPISAGGPAIGVLRIGSSRPQLSDWETLLAVCEQFARFAALAIEQARANDEARVTRDVAESAQRRLSFKARVSSLLARSLEWETTLKRLAKLLILAICDTVEIYVVSEGEATLRQLTFASSNDEVAETVQALRRRFPPALNDTYGIGYLARTGRSRLLTDGIADVLQSREAGPDEKALYETWAPHGAIATPFFAQGRVAGIICAYRDRARQALSFDDLGIIEDIARRLASYLENAQLYERERSIASALQNSLLPKDLPRIHDLRFAARYLAGGTGLDVGGDWYDVQEIDAGKTIISIGDVVGRGVFAAAAMGQFRNMLNAYAIEGVGPARTLERMNEVVLRTAGERYATVAYLIFDHVAHTLTYARAGHPPPLLLQPDGAVQMLDETTDMPVGVWPKSTYEERTVAFTPGSTLLLYTDGLVETRDRDMHTGILQLAEHFAKAPTEPEDLADNLLREFAPDRSDDTAILIVRHLSAKDTLGNRWRCEQFDAREATRLRGEILEQLEALAEPGQDLFEAALALGEVLGNVARHAPGEASIVLDWHGTRPIIAVADRGPGLSNEISQAPLDTDVLRESGRGLELIRRHVAAFEVRPRAGGGMVAEIHLELVRRRNRTQ